LAFVSAEFRSDFAAKHLFVMRFMLIFIHTLILIYILITILSDPIDPPHILLVLIIMIPLSYISLLCICLYHFYHCCNNHLHLMVSYHHHFPCARLSSSSSSVIWL
jgi:hypothetical protein